MQKHTAKKRVLGRKGHERSTSHIPASQECQKRSSKSSRLVCPLIGNVVPLNLNLPLCGLGCSDTHLDKILTPSNSFCHQAYFQVSSPGNRVANTPTPGEGTMISDCICMRSKIVYKWSFTHGHVHSTTEICTRWHTGQHQHRASIQQQQFHCCLQVCPQTNSCPSTLSGKHSRPSCMPSKIGCGVQGSVLRILVASDPRHASADASLAVFGKRQTV
jgi:hypothetical protein